MEQSSFAEIKQRISMASSIDDLRKLRLKFHEREKFASMTPLNIANKFERMNELHDRLFIRCIELSERKLSEEGAGSPPCPYVFVLFGSGGRNERTLWSDQDHGLLYECFDDDAYGEVTVYFSKLAEEVMHQLLLLGYPPCKGNVTCTNPQWRMSCSEWSGKLSQWVQEPSWENTRYLLIASDMRYLYGKAALIQSAQRQLMYLLHSRPEIMTAMLKNTLHHKVMLNVFGQVLKERYGQAAGGIDIKYGAYLPMVNGIRLLSLQAERFETSTLERLQGLSSSGAKFVSKPDLTGWEQAFLLTLKMRMCCIASEGEYLQTEGKISREQISKPLKEEILFCLHKAKELQQYLKKFGGQDS